MCIVCNCTCEYNISVIGDVWLSISSLIQHWGVMKRTPRLLWSCRIAFSWFLQFYKPVLRYVAGVLRRICKSSNAKLQNKKLLWPEVLWIGVYWKVQLLALFWPQSTPYRVYFCRCFCDHVGVSTTLRRPTLCSTADSINETPCLS